MRKSFAPNFGNFQKTGYFYILAVFYTLIRCMIFILSFWNFRKSAARLGGRTRGRACTGASSSRRGPCRRHTIPVPLCQPRHITLSKARSRLYQHRFLRPNTYLILFVSIFRHPQNHLIEFSLIFKKSYEKLQIIVNIP